MHVHGLANDAHLQDTKGPLVPLPEMPSDLKERVAKEVDVAQQQEVQAELRKACAS